MSNSTRAGLVACLMLGTRATAMPGPADAARIAQLAVVQHSVSALPTRSDRDRFGRVEYWQSADATGGDCEDKALAARDALLALGWPAAALRLALAWDETGTYHAALTIDVGGTTWVLDSRFAEPQPWSALVRRGYRWTLRQTATRGWAHVGG